MSCRPNLLATRKCSHHYTRSSSACQRVRRGLEGGGGTAVILCFLPSIASLCDTFKNSLFKPNMYDNPSAIFLKFRSFTLWIITFPPSNFSKTKLEQYFSQEKFIKLNKHQFSSVNTFHHWRLVVSGTHHFQLCLISIRCKWLWLQQPVLNKQNRMAPLSLLWPVSTAYEN